MRSPRDAIPAGPAEEVGATSLEQNRVPLLSGVPQPYRRRSKPKASNDDDLSKSTELFVERIIANAVASHCRANHIPTGLLLPSSRAVEPGGAAVAKKIHRTSPCLIGE